MNKTKILSIPRVNVATLIQFLALWGIATGATLLLSHSQIITGPIVNATLFLTVILLGTESAIMVGLVPSLIALSAGLLPPVLAPIVPFIMMGNTILILVFSYLRKGNFWAGIISASILKFLFLHYTIAVVINLLLKKEVASKVALMMSWPQLLTALVGGILAYLFLKSVKKI